MRFGLFSLGNRLRQLLVVHEKRDDFGWLGNVREGFGADDDVLDLREGSAIAFTQEEDVPRHSTHILLGPSERDDAFLDGAATDRG
jgi:hypothetical protein